MKPRMSLITLGVVDLERSIVFYRDGLGLPQEPSPPSVAFFRLNGTWLGLYGRDELAADAGISARGEGFRGFTISHNVDSEAEVRAVLDQAASAGALIVKAAQTTDWGGYAGYFADPDGHLWEIAHNPFLWIGPAD